MASSTQIHVLGGSVAPSSSMKTSNYSSTKTIFIGHKLNNNSAFGLPYSAFLKCRRTTNNFAVGPVKVVSAKVVEVDLGMTNSAMVAMEGGKLTIVTNAKGQGTMQSVVAYMKSDDRLVRQIAKWQAVVNLKNTFFSMKRFIGRKMSEVDEESKQVSYRVVRDDQTCTQSLTAWLVDFLL